MHDRIHFGNPNPDFTLGLNIGLIIGILISLLSFMDVLETIYSTSYKGNGYISSGRPK